MDALDKCKQAEKYCLQLILELLEATELVATAEALKAEARMSPIAQSRPRVAKDSVPLIMETLIQKDSNTFFQNWENLIPEEVKEELEYKRLTAYLYIYFATLPYRTEDKSVITDTNYDKQQGEDGMKMLREFLIQRGGELSTYQEFLPYFALPYVDQPSHHPTFSQIFKKCWSKDLERRVEGFLLEWSCGSCVQPELLKLVEKQDLGPKYRDIRRRFNRLRKDHHNIVGVASELATALENSVRGEAVDLRATLDNCINIFPDLFTQQQRGEYTKVARRIAYTELDGGKLKRDLREADVKTRAALLRAIRKWVRRGDREGNINWLRRNDILWLANPVRGDPYRESPVVALETSALLETLAGSSTGRDYINDNLHGLIKILVYRITMIKGREYDSILATLQKLSLRRAPCICMLEGGLLPWLIDGIPSLEGQSLEYGSALLMNLLLHADKSRYHPPRLVALLISLIQNLPDNSVLEFVLGAVYCTLSSLWEEWKQSRLEEMLKLRLDREEEESGGRDKEEEGLTEESKNRVTALLALLDQELPLSAINIITDDQIEDDIMDDSDVELEEGNQEETILQQYKLVFPPRGVVWKRGGVDIRPATPRPLHVNRVTLVSPNPKK